MNCGSCVPKVSWKSSHTIVAISFCPTDIASACSFSNSSTRSTRRLPPDFFIPIPGDRTIPVDRLHQLNKLYRSVVAALDEPVVAGRTEDRCLIQYREQNSRWGPNNGLIRTGVVRGRLSYWTTQCLPIRTFAPATSWYRRKRTDKITINAST